MCAKVKEKFCKRRERSNANDGNDANEAGFK